MTKIRWIYRKRDRQAVNPLHLVDSWRLSRLVPSFYNLPFWYRKNDDQTNDKSSNQWIQFWSIDNWFHILICRDCCCWMNHFKWSLVRLWSPAPLLVAIVMDSFSDARCIWRRKDDTWHPNNGLPASWINNKVLNMFHCIDRFVTPFYFGHFHWKQVRKSHSGKPICLHHFLE